MKNAFVASILFLLVGYPLSAAVHSLGWVPFAAMDFPAFITCFIGVGLLAIIAADYSPRTQPPGGRTRKTAPKATAAVESEPAAWTLHTLSA
jgi:hypothetical protein